MIPLLRFRVGGETDHVKVSDESNFMGRQDCAADSYPATPANPVSCQLLRLAIAKTNNKRQVRERV